MPAAPGAVLIDIEGTTTPIAFVHDVLFPYARARLPDWVARNAGHPALADAARLADGRPVLDALLTWLDADAKVTPLKTVQGLIWEAGYRAGELQGQLYPDVAPALRRWHAAGRRLYIYSSGSAAAQRLLFAHTDAGDLTGLFSGFFDTTVGSKRDCRSYRTIAHTVRQAPPDILFLSDVAEELDAAHEAGLLVTQLVRADDRTIASGRYREVTNFNAIELIQDDGPHI